MAHVVPLTVLEQRGQESGRDTSRPVMLVGFQRHSNLGLGYLAYRDCQMAPASGGPRVQHILSIPSTIWSRPPKP